MAGYIGSKAVALSTTAANVAGNITVSGNVDGRDVSVDGTKLDTIPVISTSSTASFIAISDGTTDGYIQLNCSANSHGIKLKSPPHSAGASYTLVFPVNDGNANQVLTTNGSGVLSWSTTSTTDNTKLPLAGGALTGVLTTNSNVGIGTATPQTRIHSTSSQEQLTLSEGNARGATFDYRSSTGNLNISTNGANARSSPQLILDLNGNLLVGTTDNSLYNNTTGGGFKAGGDDRTDMARQADVVVTMNRTGSSDGDIAQFRKDGGTVGSIGISGGNNLYVSGQATNHAGVTFGTDVLIPTRQGVINNNVTDLGSSGNAFKNLYLAGGVFLGGTGTANKLDDYDESTFTARLRGGSANGSTITTTAKCVKVGSLVSYHFGFENVNTTGYSGQIQVDGFPYANHGSRVIGNLMLYLGGTWSSTQYPNSLMEPGATKIIGMSQVSQGAWVGINHNPRNTVYMFFTGSYTTTA